MGKKFLNSEDLQQAERLLTPPLILPNGDESFESSFKSYAFSHWVETQLETQLGSLPGWREAMPIALGSWARGELCLDSDIDILFCGEETAIASLTRHIQEAGIKIRARVPENSNDWTQGVEAFDILALWQAKPFSAPAAVKLKSQQDLLFKNKKQWRQKLLSAIVKERRAREVRHDSITNFLEPNIKYGPGALRDLQQALQIYELFSEKFPNTEHALKVLKYYRSFYLLVRQKLHLMNYQDNLVGTAQFELSTWFGFKSNQDFMREIQKGLSRVSFYADWIIEVARVSPQKISKTERLTFKNISSPQKALKKESSLLVQNRIRVALQDSLSAKAFKKKDKRIGMLLDELMQYNTKENFLVSVFRSRLIDRYIPEMARLTGYVQHDQYHRFTADAHILQVLKEVKRLSRQSKIAGPSQDLIKTLNKTDWRILSWAALYHDLAKGMSGDHDKIAEKWVERDLTKFGFKKSFVKEVQWLVKEHLTLSEAAFKRNPQSATTWQWLSDKDLTSERLVKLLAFTIADIRGTNPDAWNNWKARLISDLSRAMLSSSTKSFLDLLKSSPKNKNQEFTKFISQLDSWLIASLPKKVWLEEFKKLQKTKGDLEVFVIRTRGQGTWVRFHSQEDQPGLFLSFVSKLYQSGCRINHALIYTSSDYGVYDWFQVQTNLKTEQIKKRLSLSHNSDSKKKIFTQFNEILIISKDKDEWVISFKGKNKEGMLLSAARALYESGATILSARVHTWGREIEDIFNIKPLEDSERLLSELKKKLEVTEL